MGKKTKSFDDECCRLFNCDWRNLPIEDASLDLILTSPPYNIGSNSPAKIGFRKYGKYDPKSFRGIRDYADMLPEAEYQQQQTEFILWSLQKLKSDGVLLYNHKWRYVKGVLIDPVAWFPHGGYVERDRIVWDRLNTHNHTQVRTYQVSEIIYALAKPGAKPYFKNEDYYWKDKKNGGVSNVMQVKRSNKVGHNAPMPTRLARQLIRLWSKPGALVCDPYSGSGTTMIASAIEGRRFVGAEILLKYYRLAVNRYKKSLTQEDKEAV